VYLPHPLFKHLTGEVKPVFSQDTI